MTEHETHYPRKSGCWKFLACGCLSLILIGLVGSYFAYTKIQSYLVEIAEKYTDTEPQSLPVLDISQEKVDDVIARSKSFHESLQDDAAVAPIQLSAEDINILIQRGAEEDGANILADKVFVYLVDDRVQGDVSIPLDEFADALKENPLFKELSSRLAGRFLNGSATFQIAMTAGRLSIFIDSITVNGEVIPEEVMGGVRSKNLAEKVNADPENQKLLSRIESISVKDGILTISPKQPQ